jgi:four helix bundle protein
MTQQIRTFRDLVAWQKAMELAKAIYLATQSMSTAERFGLIDQMRRAAISVPSNIAEGYGRQGRTDYLRFLKLARGSLAELITQYELATSLGLLTPATATGQLLEETERVLQSLITSLHRTR